MTFDGSGDITSLVATPTVGGTITLTGGAATFASGATITVNAPGTLVFAERVTSLGALAINRGDGAYLAWSSNIALTNQLTATPCFQGFSAADRDNGKVEFYRLVSTGPVDSANVYGQQGHWNRVAYTGSGIFLFNKVSAAYTFSARVQLGPKTSGENNLYARCLTGIRSPRFGLYPEEEAGWASKNLYSEWVNKSHHAERGRYSVGDSYGTNLGGTEELGFRKIIIRRNDIPNGMAYVRFGGGATLSSSTTLGAGVEAIFVAAATDDVSLGSAISGDGDIRLEGASVNATTTLACDMSGLVGGLFTIEGLPNADLSVMANSGTKFPCGGEVHVNTNSILKLNGDNLANDYYWKQSLFVHRGGTLRTVAGWQVKAKQQLVVDGGTFDTLNGTMYLNYAVFSNATMEGNNSPRSVYQEALPKQYWRVIGTEPSNLNSLYGVNVYGYGTEAAARNASCAFRIDVSDVTGNSNVDCMLKRINSDTGTTAVPWFWFEKYGAGTLSLAGNSKHVRLESKLYNGTLLLAGNDIMTNAVELLGGSLAVDAGKSNSLGALTAYKAGTLSVGAGGSLSFASFTPDAGLTTKSITIDAPMDGNMLRIGTDGNGLAPAHYQYFRWKDTREPTKFRRVVQDEDGYLHPVIAGAMVIVK